MASIRRTPEQIRADMAEARRAVAVGIEGLISEVHPTAIKNKATDDVKDLIGEAKDQAKAAIGEAVGFFYDHKGVRWDNVGTVVLATSSVVAAGAGVRGVAGLLMRVVR